MIDELSSKGNAQAIRFPRPLIHRDGYDFSFSGLKTAVKYELASLKTRGESVNVADLAASFQQAVVDVLVKKVTQAAADAHVSQISVTGGVAANRQLRAELESAAARHGIAVYFPPLSLCTDNGAMVACLAYHMLQRGETSGLDLEAYANAPLPRV